MIDEIESSESIKRSLLRKRIKLLIDAGAWKEARNFVEHLTFSGEFPNDELAAYRNLILAESNFSEQEKLHAYQERVEAEVNKRQEAAVRTIVLFVWMILMLAPAIVLSVSQFVGVPRIIETSSVVAAAIALLGATGFLMSSYLNPEKSIFKSVLERIPVVHGSARNPEERRDGKSSDSDELTKKVERLSADVQGLKDESGSLSRSDRQKLVNELRDSVMSDASAAVLDQIKHSVADSHRSDARLHAVARQFEAIESRLHGETKTIEKAARLNLVAGSLLTIVALGFLIFFVFGQPSQIPAPSVSLGPDSTSHLPNTPNMLSHFVPRIGLIIAIEAFALFFLRLYKQCLTEAKYYQNELTNVQSRRLALSLVSSNSEAPINETAALLLLQTERNFVLKKGESTVELEKLRTNVSLDKAFVAASAGVAKAGVSAVQRS